MKRLKKQAAILILLSFMFPIITSMASFEDIKGTENETAIRMLTALGLIDSETNQYFYPADPVRRGEACNIFAGLKGDFTLNVNENQVYYLNWISTQEEGAAITGPVVVKVCDPEVWWSKKKIESYQEQLKADFPNLVSIEQFGETVGHYSIKAIIAGNRKNLIACIGLSMPENQDRNLFYRL